MTIGSPLISRDEDDGGWQFLNNEPGPNEADVFGLGEIVQLDASITALAGLPLGWHAWRVSKASPWRRAKS